MSKTIKKLKGFYSFDVFCIQKIISVTVITHNHIIFKSRFNNQSSYGLKFEECYFSSQTIGCVMIYLPFR